MKKIKIFEKIFFVNGFWWFFFVDQLCVSTFDSRPVYCQRNSDGKVTRGESINSRKNSEKNANFASESSTLNSHDTIFKIRFLRAPEKLWKKIVEKNMFSLKTPNPEAFWINLSELGEISFWSRNLHSLHGVVIVSRES